MLQLRPNCELCDLDLPPESSEARICTYECTFCASCVEQVLHDVCPNCGGGFVPRPVRPRSEWRPGVTLARHPAAIGEKHRPVDAEAHRRFAAPIAAVAPHER